MRRGPQPRSVWLRKVTGTVTPKKRSRCAPVPHARVPLSPHPLRRRCADGARIRHILTSCLPSVDALESSLYVALERAGNRPVRALQRLRAVLFSAEQAKLLQAKERDAGLLSSALDSRRRPRRGVHPVLLSRRHL